MDPLIWAALLILLGLTLAVMEIFVPSGGILGFLAVTATLAGVILAFVERGAGVGLLFLVITVISIPSAMALALKWWPETAMGRRILLGIPTSEEMLPDSEQRRMLRGLVGKVGHAKSMMLPSGAVLVDGHTVDALSEGMPIEPGQLVRVIDVRGQRVVVRPTDDPAPLKKTDDILSQPIDTVGLDPFQDPLA